MPSLLERLREALAPRYDVERELASGGMGTVFLARDTQLHRPVAIKILRPELATASSADRFLREARTLADLRHPNIVPIHDQGERGGFFYYVMDYLEGDTLADRLAHGALPVAVAVRLGRDLLDALEAAHRQGVVHRDVKPSNVFLEGERAILTDFGVAKSRTDPGAGLTGPGQLVGTPDYMPPEQLAGAEVTPRTDLYAAAMVVYEALTGRHMDDPESASWSGVPHGVARALRRALAWSSADRWPDARAFRRALWVTRTRKYVWRTRWLAIGGVLVGGTVEAMWHPAARAVERSRHPADVRIRIAALRQRSGTPWPELGDSIGRGLARRLAGYPDLSVRGPGDDPWKWWDVWRSVTALDGVFDVSGDELRVELQPRGGLPRLPAARGSARAWPALVDGLADDAYGALLAGRSLDATLPPAMRAKTPEGMRAFLEAEALFAGARWGRAYAAYGAAAAADSTCWICYWRHDEVGRWHSLEHDTVEQRRIRAHVAEFPPHYQSLIRAELLLVTTRLDTLEALANRARDFLFGEFRLADELAHRGPLVGRPRREAVARFRNVLRLRPGFGPAWEHLAWLYIAEGDSAAAAALDSLDRAGAADDQLTWTVRALLRIAFAWRFQEQSDARRLTAAAIGRAEAAGLPDIDAGGRMLLHFGVPHGAVHFARLIEARPVWERSALITRVFGQLALGRPDSARTVLRTLRARFPAAELELFADELEAVLLAFDDDSVGRDARWEALRRSLTERATMRASPADARRRATWMLHLTARLLGVGDDLRPSRAVLDGEPAPRPLGTLLRAVDLAARGEPARALAVSDTLTALQAGPADDPFFRTVLHLVRADWHTRLGQIESARRELLWHENSDVFTSLTGDPEAVEVDWTFGALARWRWARLLEGAGADGGEDELCRAYRAVARLWAGGEAVYAARAETARGRAAAACDAPR
ncbi:MAG: protein kinase domain-containing protein [Gemmatimonadales bacterium]